MAKHVPQRMCVICREMKPKKELIRLVRTETGLSLDTGGRKPGRGFYICFNRETADQLFSGKRLEKIVSGSIPAETRQELKAELMVLIEEREKQEAALNRPELVTFDEEGRKVRRIPVKDQNRANPSGGPSGERK